MTFTHEQIPEDGIELLKEHGIKDEAVFQRGDWVADKEQGIYLVLTEPESKESEGNSTYCLLFEEYAIYFDVKTYRVVQEPTIEEGQLVEKGLIHKDILIYDMPKKLLDKKGIIRSWIEKALSTEDQNYNEEIHRFYYMYKKIVAGMGFVHETIPEEGICFLKEHGVTDELILKDGYWMADKDRGIYLVFFDNATEINRYTSKYGLFFENYTVFFGVRSYRNIKEPIFGDKILLEKGKLLKDIILIDLPEELERRQTEIVDWITEGLSVGSEDYEIQIHNVSHVDCYFF